LASALQLQRFSDEEIGAAFDEADRNRNGVLEPREMDTFAGMDYAEVCTLVGADEQKDYGIPREFFVSAVANLAERLDYRIYPIAVNLVLTGLAEGTLGPAMPLLISQLGLSTAQAGILTTGFGLAKLLGNIPFGVAADKYGRRSVMVFGCSCVTLGVFSAAVGATWSCYELLLLERVLNGVGLSALFTGALVAAADVSTPRNRARSMAPMYIGYNCGNAIGPFAAGVVISAVGLKYALCGTGAMLGLNTLSSFATVKETKPSMITSELGFMEAYQAALQTWISLLQSGPLRQASLYQALFWSAMGGGFMTCLPMLLGSPNLGLSPNTLGMCFGGFAVTNAVAAQPLATLVDKFGKEGMLMGGIGLLGASSIMLPLCHDLATLSMALGGWAVAFTLVYPIPQAIAIDHVGPADRSNATAMVRTFGDIGLVAGGILAGVLGNTLPIETILVVLGCTCVGTSVGNIFHRYLRKPN